MDMEDRRQLYIALTERFPGVAIFSAAMHAQFDFLPETITTGPNLFTVVPQVIDWAEANGQLDRLRTIAEGK